MSVFSTYTDGRDIRFKVTIGRRTLKGFRTAEEAATKGIEAALADDQRLHALLNGKPLDRQVGIVFGAEARNRFFGNAA